jgi:hypothetical protein
MFRVPMGEFKRGPRTYKMSHMIASTEQELHAMADKIGVARRWYQGDHYDITKTKRDLAVRAGAVEISMRALAAMSMNRREGLPMGDPATAMDERIKRRQKYK